MEEQNPVLRDPGANPVLRPRPARPRPVRPPPPANPQVQAPQQPGAAPSGGSPGRGGRRGTIRRRGYTRKSGVHVPSAAIVDVGHPGKGVLGTGKPGIGPLKKGELKAVGYSVTAKASSRHRALTKAIKRYGPLSTYRKLNAVAVYTKRTAPGASKTFKADRDWVGRKAGYGRHRGGGPVASGMRCVFPSQSGSGETREFEEGEVVCVRIGGAEEETGTYLRTDTSENPTTHIIKTDDHAEGTPVVWYKVGKYERKPSASAPKLAPTYSVGNSKFGVTSGGDEFLIET